MAQVEKVKVETACSACRGTGLYAGIGEREGLAVVCKQCDGTGCKTLEYEPFTGLKPRDDVLRVLQVNPGIVLRPSDTQGGSELPGMAGTPGSRRRAGTRGQGDILPRLVVPAGKLQPEARVGVLRGSAWLRQMQALPPDGRVLGALRPGAGRQEGRSRPAGIAASIGLSRIEPASIRQEGKCPTTS